MDLSVTFRYGGRWAQVKNQARKRYDGGKQKTSKFQKDILSFDVLIDEVKVICPWMRLGEFELFYHICGTSPKEYTLITNDVEVMEMIAQSIGTSRAEVLVVTEDGREAGIYAEQQEVRGGCQTLECSQSRPLCVTTYIFDNEVRSQELLLTHSRCDDDLFVGARFHDSQGFKQVLRTKAIVDNFGVKIKASNRARVVAVCAHQGCPWRVRATSCADDQSFEVRKLEPMHLCPGINRAGNKQATSSWIANEIQDLVKQNPDIPPKQIKLKLENTYGLSLPYMKLWRSREQARDSIFGSVDDNYKWVPALHAELIKRNHGSHVTYYCSKHGNSFKRFFVSFKVSIDGFLAGCRPLVGLDACHLKSKYLGVLLSATALDGSNGLFTLAFAVTESESKKSWKWFLEELAIAIGFDLYPLAFISDMEKGLAEAIKYVYPNAEHRVCIRHLWKNMKKFFRCYDNHKIQTLVWSAANAYTMIEYNAKMEEICSMSPPIHSYLLNLPYKWSRSTYNLEVKNHYNTSNMSESFNSWIGEARGKPVVDLIDMVRGMLMEQRSQRKLNSYTWKGVLVPYAEDYIRDLTTRKDHFIMRQSTVHIAEIEGRNERHIVDIDKGECTCRVWQMTGLPCIHAAAFIGSTEHPLWHNYVDKCYYVYRYRAAYDGHISTLPGKDQWMFVDGALQVNVPNTLRPRGRPKKRRIKNFLELTFVKKNRSVHKCGRCGLWGHHKTTCKNPLLHQTIAEQEAYGTDEPQSNNDCILRAKLPIRREGVI